MNENMSLARVAKEAVDLRNQTAHGKYTRKP